METHRLAEEMGWVVGKDFPEWGNNDLYLTAMRKGYVRKGKTPRQEYQRLARTAASYIGDHFPETQDEIFKLLWNGWLIPSSPVMFNFGTDRGLPISCFSGRVPDTMHGIARKETELRMLSKIGGGTAYDFSQVRPLGSPIKNGLLGTSDGIIPFIKCHDSIILSAKQGDMRRGAVAIYLNIEHQEYDNFLTIREPKGDVNRQCMNIHQGATISDKFMQEVESKNGKARERWLSTIKQRIKTGEPYTFFIDNANKTTPDWWPKHLKIWHSNLCSEIMLPTDDNHTLVCCLSSMNLLKYDEWKSTDAVFWATIFLDCVLEEFIQKGQSIPGIEDAVRFAQKSRALGLGALGWHSYLQSKSIPFISLAANALTHEVFGHMKNESWRASQLMAKHLGMPEWCIDGHTRNLTNLAIAPNRSSAKLAGGVTQGVEPMAANIYVDDDPKGLFIRRNPILERVLQSKDRNIPQVWDQINQDRGSVMNVRCLSDHEKEVFRTFKEINQLELVKQAGIRQKYIDQGQSINVAFHQDAPAKFINKVHLTAWKEGLKALYYYRSESILRADSNVRDLYSECQLCEG